MAWLFATKKQASVSEAVAYGYVLHSRALDDDFFG